MDPIESFNIRLSSSLQERLRALGYQINTFDQLAEKMVSVLESVSKVAELETKLSNLTAESLSSKARSFGLKEGSVEANKLRSKTAKITREGDQITYDFDDIIKGIPSDMTVVNSTFSMVSGDGRNRAGGTGNKGVKTIPGSNSTASFAVNIQTKKGIISLTRTVPLPEADGESEITLDVRDMTTSVTEMNIAQHLEVLSATVASLSQKVNG